MNNSRTVFRTEKTLPVVELSNAYGKLEISLYGAHVLSWTPAGKKDVLWMSPLSPWEKGKPLRGGIPVCFPWLSKKTDHPEWPIHGFVRTQVWNMESIGNTDEDSRVLLSLDSGPVGESYGYGPFRLSMEFRLSDKLTVIFTVENRSDETLVFENALHTYFAGNPKSIRTDCFDGMTFYDKKAGYEKRTMHGSLSFPSEGELSWFGKDTGDFNEMSFDGGKIMQHHPGFRDTVVWNSGEKGGLANPEIGSHWNEFFCLESVNARDNTISLKAGASYKAALTITAC